VLSSHLLDEVERTCDAVAIVDRARSSDRVRFRTAGRSVDDAADRVLGTRACARPARRHDFAADIDVVAGGLVLNLPAGKTRELIAEVRGCW